MSADAEAFILAIVRLARALRLSVIAEGVETPLQQHRLITAGCMEMQGYLFSKPISAAEIDAFRAKPVKAILAA